MTSVLPYQGRSTVPLISTKMALIAQLGTKHAVRYASTKGTRIPGPIHYSRYATPRAVSPPIKLRDKNSKLVVDTRNASLRVKQNRENIVNC
jgi:hypothetical protein